MTYQIAQNLLTFSAEIITVAGLAGIILHAFYNAFIKPVNDLYKPYNNEWLAEQIEWSKQVVAAHKAPEPAPEQPIAYEYACPLTCEVPVVEVAQPKAKRTRKSTKKTEVIAEKPVEKVAQSKTKRTRKAA